MNGSQRRHLHFRVAGAAPVLARFVEATPVVPPDAAHQRRQKGLPPPPRVPSAEIAVKVLGSRRLADEHRQAEVAAGLVQKAVDETRLLLRGQLARPELVEVAPIEDATGGEIAAGQRVADAEAEEIVLKAGGLADEARAVGRGAALEVEVHVRVAGATLGGNLELVQRS